MNIFYQYLSWQFLDTPKEMIKGWRNFLVFNLNFFSVPLLLKTFFAPWRYHETYGRRFDPKRYLEVFVMNLFSRSIGVILRIFLIIFGVLFEAIIFLVGIPVLIIWIFLPLILAIIFSLGLALAFF